QRRAHRAAAAACALDARGAACLERQLAPRRRLARLAQPSAVPSHSRRCGAGDRASGALGAARRRRAARDSDRGARGADAAARDAQRRRVQARRAACRELRAVRRGNGNVTAHRRRNGVSAAMWLCAWCLSLCMLASCSSTTQVYVSRRDARAAVHVVQRGETLTKIAWQHRVDPQELASWNGIQNADELRVGQRLRLVPPRGYVAAAPAPATSASTPPAPPRASTTKRSSPSATTPAARSTPPPVARPSGSGGAAPASTPVRWSWPTDGSIVSRFGADGSVGSGLGIGGRAGQPVRAAAAGRVVYAGGGLIGYGQL